MLIEVRQQRLKESLQALGVDRELPHAPTLHQVGPPGAASCLPSPHHVNPSGTQFSTTVVT